MAPFKIACEHCDASFKISDPAKIGKRVKCPKCGEPFTVRKPDDEDDFGGDDFDAPPAKPARRPPVKKGGGSVRKAPAKDGPSVMMLAGGGAGVVVLLLGTLWLAGMFGGSTPPAVAIQPEVAAPPQASGPAISAILDRLPGTAEVVVHVRVKDAMSTPLVAGLRTPDFDAQFKAPNPLIPGTTISGIETITLAMSNVSLQLSEQKRLAAVPGAGGTPVATEPLVLVTLNDPLTPEFLNFPPESAVKHGSATIYRRPQPMLPGTPPCLLIVEPKIVALGTEPQLQTLLSQTSAEGAAADFKLLEANSHLAVAICPRNIVQQIERLAINNLEPPALHRELNQFVAKGGKSFGLQLSLTSDLEAAVTVLAADPAKLSELQAIVDAKVKSMQDEFAAATVATNPMLAALKPVVDGLNVAASGDRVSVATVMPKDALVGLGQMGMAMAGPMMMNVAAPPGPPGESPTAAP